ncbi:UNKNOWN [Stylonychia lemnae]|uniref:Macro domain-containing protein n=1 Tax=Stylonychia lemnae TaxID=5949 RepID=A0A078AAV1_STYLE|nr:UNKNOWN [Stylonychia lemnae]|eukprot:CDW78737.1 UNKNOWN [Stylonychia lemnae]
MKDFLSNEDIDQDDDDGLVLKHKIGSINLILKQGDITLEKVDAIVNASNENLKHIGGLAAAIVKRGGQSIQIESDLKTQDNKSFPAGSVVLTKPGSLKCKKIFHAVGPYYSELRDKDSCEKLEKTFKKCIRTANLLKFSSIAIPPISTGIYNFPKQECAKILFDVIEKYSQVEEFANIYLTKIKIVIIDQMNFDIFEKEFIKRYYEEKGDKTINENHRRKETVNNINQRLRNNCQKEEEKKTGNQENLKLSSSLVAKDFDLLQIKDTEENNKTNASNQILSKRQAPSINCIINILTLLNLETIILSCKHCKVFKCQIRDDMNFHERQDCPELPIKCQNCNAEFPLSIIRIPANQNRGARDYQRQGNEYGLEFNRERLQINRPGFGFSIGRGYNLFVMLAQITFELRK